jgi:hypothetical protein
MIELWQLIVITVVFFMLGVGVGLILKTDYRDSQ